MSLLRRSSRETAPTVSREELTDRAAALRHALDAGGRHLPEHDVAAVRAAEQKVAERTSIAGSRTVAALAGATGSGKSTLFNLLVGEEVSHSSARRPTTSRSTAAIWGKEPSGPLLDWLDVDARHHVGSDGPAAAELDGLVLLDLPDLDSKVSAHRAEADRLLHLVDVFVWVTDPQKYADAVLHDDYLKGLATQASVTVVVLNQADRLSPDEEDRCLADLRGLLQRDGIEASTLLATSARTGAGIPDLGEALAAVVQHRNAAEQRLMGDLRTRAATLRAHVADAEPDLGTAAPPELVEALSRAAGVPVVLDAVEKDYQRRAAQATGWPFTRWTSRLRSAPLRRLGLDSVITDESARSMSRSDARSMTGRSSIPHASPAARAAVDVATRRVGESAGKGLPPSWAQEVHEAASPEDRTVVDALDRAVTGTSLSSRRPAWWGVVNVVQMALATVAVAGLAWLVLLMALGWFQLDVEAPTWGGLPVPLLMLVGGLLAGLLLSALSAVLAARAARRRRRQAERELHGAVSEVAQQHVLEPVRDVLHRHRQTRTSLERAAA